MFSKILVATDGSDHAGKAIRVAGNIAGRYGARLYVVHVITDQPVPSALRRLTEAEQMIEDDETDTFGQVSPRLSPASTNRRLAAAVGAKVIELGVLLAKREGATDVTPLELHGEAAPELTSLAGKEQIDLVVIGSRGFGPLGQLVHGSVSTRLAQAVGCPCLIVK